MSCRLSDLRAAGSLAQSGGLPRSLKVLPLASHRDGPQTLTYQLGVQGVTDEADRVGELPPDPLRRNPGIDRCRASGRRDAMAV